MAPNAVAKGKSNVAKGKQKVVSKEEKEGGEEEEEEEEYIPEEDDGGEYYEEPVVDEINEVALAEFMALKGWSFTNASSPYHLHPIRNIAADIPSPFANPYAEVDPRLWDRMTGPVQHLWDQFHSRPKPAEKFVPRDGSIVCCGLYKEDGDTVPTKYYTIKSDSDQLIVDIDNDDKCFYLRRLMRVSGTKEEGFFVVNQDCDHFLINGQLIIGRGAVAGPLPDFAVIELDSTAVFWWRNYGALSYDPAVSYSNSHSIPSHVAGSGNSGVEQGLPQKQQGVKRKRSIEDEGESKKLKISHHGDKIMTSKSDEVAPPPQKGSIGAEKGATPADVSHKHHDNTSQCGDGREASHSASPSRRTWQDILRDGMIGQRQRKTKVEALERAQPRDGFTVIKRSNDERENEMILDMSEDEMILAIATFWEALRRNGQLFAFAGISFFEQLDSRDEGDPLILHGVVGAPNELIMPLLLHRRQKKGPDEPLHTKQIGHLALAIAKWDPNKKKIRLDILDSRLPDRVFTKKRMIDRAKRLIIGSRWPYDQEKRLPPAFLSKVETLASPHQEGVNTCGLYVVLNAWCVMLGIPISNTDKRRTNKRGYKNFLQGALEMINLALVGCMDAHTVQAFLNVWGYSQAQTPEEALTENVTAVRMGRTELHRALHRQTVAEGRGWRPEPKEVTDLIDVAGLKERVTFEEMEAALIDEEGDGNLAILRLLSSTPVVSPAAKPLQKKASDDGESSMTSEQRLEKALELSLQSRSPSSRGIVTGDETNP